MSFHAIRNHRMSVASDRGGTTGVASNSKPRKPRGTARVAFRANLEIIRAELEQGWPARAIYDRHIATLDVMSYRQFARYVSALRTEWSVSLPAPGGEGLRPVAALPSPSSLSPDPDPRAPRQFHWNPSPKKEDFI
jgi:hypothetical protein